MTNGAWTKDRRSILAYGEGAAKAIGISVDELESTK
jgi:hypothetical protein